MDHLLQGDDDFYNDMFPLKTDGISDKTSRTQRMKPFCSDIFFEKET